MLKLEGRYLTSNLVLHGNRSWGAYWWRVEDTRIMWWVRPIHPSYEYSGLIHQPHAAPSETRPNANDSPQPITTWRNQGISRHAILSESALCYTPVLVVPSARIGSR